MNLNVASQNNGVVAHAAAIVAEAPVDIRHHVNFGFTFQVVADIAVAAVFEIEAAPPDAVDTCIPGPWHDVAEVLSCDWRTTAPLSISQVTVPVGTKAGSICTGTLPCKPDAFIRVRPVSGDTGKVNVVVVLGGPK